MIFWDSSAVAPLVVREPASDTAAAIIEADTAMIVWWATPIECHVIAAASCSASPARKLWVRSSRPARSHT